ncbi:MAG: hypothetical protein UZ05_CHB002001192 [Chlorobi bacterium OLB5]|nr:MAG: hypothetical protein UZ05_CHB002001192 [Chlorobi bacterium OLB5]
MNKSLTFQIKSFIAILALFILASCGSDDKVINNPDPPEPVDTSDFQYPFTDGSNWSYTLTYSAENIRPDSIRYRFAGYPLTGYGYSEIMYDTTIPLGGEVKVIYDKLEFRGDTTASRFYYTQNEYSMICYGYRGGTNVSFPYRPANGTIISSAGRSFSSLNELSSFAAGYTGLFSASGDTFINESPIVIVLKYPVTSGFQWLFKDFGTFTINKKYLAFENYHLDTSVISCIKTQRINSYNNDYVMYDYYSKYGQMKRDYLFRNTQVKNEFGITIGYADFREVYMVTSFHIAAKK